VLQRGMRPFTSIEDLKLRVSAIQKSELAVLAEVGALNFIAGEKHRIHRRDALWQVERAARRAGPLFETEALSAQTDARSNVQSGDSLDPGADFHSPLLQMNSEERLVADFRGTGMTVGPHPMAYHRGEMKRRGICSAIELRNLPDGANVRVGGAVIARQRPGTAKGFVFLSLEDETGIANAIITPQLFEEDHVVVVKHPFLLIEGKLQNQEGVVSVKAERVRPLSISRAKTTSHDFH